MVQIGKECDNQLRVVIVCQSELFEYSYSNEVIERNIRGIIQPFIRWSSFFPTGYTFMAQ